MQEPNTSAAPDDPQPKAAPPATVTDAAYGETWFTATGAIADPRPPLTHDLDVDVCIIGGGLAGLSTALEVARKGWSVAVLEARRVAWNASSRNAGFVRPGFDQTPRNIVSRVGEDHARELWTLSQDGVDHVRRSIKDGSMQDVAQGEGWLHVSKTDCAREVSDEAELLRGLGADIEVWPANLVRSKVKSPGYFQAIHFPTAFNIDPYRYALGLASLAEAAGARIFEATAAVSIDAAGVRKRIVTAQGRVRAAHIVFAGNVHLGPVMPELTQTLVAVHTFAVVTKPLGDTLATAIEYPGAVSDTDFADHHYRIVGGDRLIFAGRVATWEASPRRYGRRLRADLRRRFPQLGLADIEHAWAGAIGITVHRMPQIGEITPGVWLASGFGGHGINTTAMAGGLISGAIVEGDDRFRLFEPFEMVWAGGRTGRLVVKGLCFACRTYEQWASHRARMKEAWRIKNAADEAAEAARMRAEQAAGAAQIERGTTEGEQAAAARRLERERIAAEKTEAKRIRAEEKAAAQAEAMRLKEERRAAIRAEKEKIAAAQAEATRIEAERLALLEAEAKRQEADRLVAERMATAESAVERLANVTAGRPASLPVADATPPTMQDEGPPSPDRSSDAKLVGQSGQLRPQRRRGVGKRR